MDCSHKAVGQHDLACLIPGFAVRAGKSTCT
jgi:hypothetical protein